MENYVKARTEEVPCACPFAGLLAPDTPEVRVRDGSKIRNLLRFALSRVEAAGSPGEQAAPCGQVVFTASGKGVSKAITCAEVVKRRVKGLHQLTRLQQQAAEEVWEPRDAAAGLDPLTVSRKLPAVWILLSREPLDCGLPGYQAPGRHDALWAPEQGAAGPGTRPPQRKRRGGAGGGAKGPGRQATRSGDATK